MSVDMMLNDEVLITPYAVDDYQTGAASGLVVIRCSARQFLWIRAADALLTMNGNQWRHSTLSVTLLSIA